MNDQVKYLIKVVLIFFCAISLIDLMQVQSFEFKNILNLLSSNVSCALFFALIYEKWLWQYDFFHQIKNINGDYCGEISFERNKNFETKLADVKIKQSLLSTRVTLKTDEITSTTISSVILKENDAQILYYTYVINPKNMYSKKNPIHHGTCRFLLDDTKNISGTYWGSTKTNGDIILTKK